MEKNLEQQIAELNHKLYVANKANAELEGDVRATISAFLRVFKTLNIDINDMRDQQTLMRKLPSITGTLTTALIGGGLETIQSDLACLQPLITKYQYLLPTLE